MPSLRQRMPLAPQTDLSGPKGVCDILLSFGLLVKMKRLACAILEQYVSLTLLTRCCSFPRMLATLLNIPERTLGSKTFSREDGFFTGGKKSKF